jgi:ribose transport system ATP-binding protein
MVEVIHLSHRVYVMSEGSITRELTGDEISEENIMKHAIPNGHWFERGRYGKS